MFFRPEEVDCCSERVERLTRLIAALPEPDHHTVGLWPRPGRRRGKRQRITTVMAGRDDVDGFPNHWRKAERVGCATGVTFPSARKSYTEGRRCGRERVGEVDVTSPDADDVLVIEGGQGMLKLLGVRIRRGRDDILD